LVRELLREDPTRASQRAPGGTTPLHELPEELAVAEPISKLLLEHGADPTALDDGGKSALDTLNERGRDEVADLLEGLLPERP
jgi:ankyrin repeat protein